MLLYKNLHVRNTATTEEVERSYKILAYAYTNTKNSDGLVEINTAYGILKDPTKRAFYDRFGDESIAALTNSTTSHFITSFFTLPNVILLFLFFYLFVINYFFLGFTFYFTMKTVYRFILFITSPILLVLICLNSLSRLEANNPYLSIFGTFTAICVLNSLSILIVASDFDPYLLLGTETVLNSYILWKLYFKSAIWLRISIFLLIKSSLLFCYFLHIQTLNYFIPFFVASSTSIFGLFEGSVLGLIVFITCLSIFLTANEYSSVIAVVLNGLHATLGLFLILIMSRYLNKIIVGGNMTLLALPEPASV